MELSFPSPVHVKPLFIFLLSVWLCIYLYLFYVLSSSVLHKVYISLFLYILIYVCFFSGCLWFVYTCMALCQQIYLYDHLSVFMFSYLVCGYWCLSISSEPVDVQISLIMSVSIYLCLYFLCIYLYVGVGLSLMLMSIISLYIVFVYALCIRVGHETWNLDSKLCPLFFVCNKVYLWRNFSNFSKKNIFTYAKMQ